MSKIIKNGDTFIIEYDLFELPTAQHKAGLAGLLVHLESLRKRLIIPLPEVKTYPTSAQMLIDRQSLQTLFDDLYDAKWREVASSKKFPKKEPKRIEERETAIKGETKTKKFFIYDTVEPLGQFLQAFFPDGDGVWINLWREMIWNIMRDRDKKRLVYQERCAGNPSSLAQEFWNGFEKTCFNLEKSKTLTDSISSSIFLGAEGMNPERVPFQGTWPDNLLLHFWPLVSLIYVPRTLSLERSKGQGIKVKSEPQGLVLAIPEPANLKDFRDDIIYLLRSLNPSQLARWPKDALIDLMEEGGLEYLYNFMYHKIQDQEMQYSLCAVELYHVIRKGKRVRQLNAQRILPNFQVIRDYEQTCDRTANPFFKQLNLSNILASQPWYTGAFSLFQQYTWPIFISVSGQTPRDLRFFGLDVRDKFLNLEQSLQIQKQGGPMEEKEKDDQLALRIYRLIQSFVQQRSEEKSGKSFKDFPRDDKNRIRYPKEYWEAREKICSDVFLAMRARRDQDFIDYFTSAVCSVPNFLPEADFILVATALMEDWFKLKTLSMLALSAHSYLSGIKEEEVAL